jgi:hypothetical protein
VPVVAPLASLNGCLDISIVLIKLPTSVNKVSFSWPIRILSLVLPLLPVTKKFTCVCLFDWLFIAARTIFQHGCYHHYQWQGCKFKHRLLAVIEGSFTPHLLRHRSLIQKIFKHSCLAVRFTCTALQQLLYVKEPLLLKAMSAKHTVGLNLQPCQR